MHLARRTKATRSLQSCLLSLGLPSFDVLDVEQLRPPVTVGYYPSLGIPLGLILGMYKMAIQRPDSTKDDMFDNQDVDSTT
jgi:hypothetical protein